MKKRSRTRGIVARYRSAAYGIESLEHRQLLTNMLVFTAQPTTTNAGSIINSPTGVQVTVETSAGVPITTSTDSITISIGANPAGAALSGTLTVNAVGGVATFSNLTINTASNNYTLAVNDASDTSVSGATSASFHLDAVPGFETLYTFGAGNNYTEPEGNLVVDGSGNLYGTTAAGGLYNDGTLFELSGPTHSTFTVLVSFSGTTGNYLGTSPDGLAIDSTGNLFGATGAGGALNDGTIFELAANHTDFSSLISFTGSSGNFAGSSPANLALDSNGNLYGTSMPISGGYGTIFELAADHATFTTLITFTGYGGSYPGLSPNSILIDGNGNLFGTTRGGGGTIFELAANHTTFTTLVTTFTGIGGSHPGEFPSRNLVMDSAGDLFGLTQLGGGQAFEGNLYELAADHTTFTSLVNFSGPTGAYPGVEPAGTLYMDGSGNLYGTTTGASGFNGTAFELAANHTNFTNLFSFTGTSGSHSGSQATGFVSDSRGNLYGFAASGGSANDGLIYEIPVAGVNSLLISGSVTVASPFGSPMSSLSEYFSIVSVGAGASVALTSVASEPTVLLTTGLTLAGTTSGWTGQIDSANNDLDITSGSLAIITNQVRQGFNSGAWSGEGITSSTAAADSTYLTALGVIQNNQSGSAIYSSTNLFDGTVPGASDILVKYTYYGDANLDGKVDGSDYTRIDAGFNSQKTSTPLTGWFNGDFNYDGKIDGSDYTLIDNAFNRQGVSLAAQIAAVRSTSSTAVFSTTTATAATVFGDTNDPADDKRRRVIDDVCL